METILLDTDVYSYLIRRSDTRGEIYRPLVENKRIALSFISVGELYVWLVKRKWGARAIAAFEEKVGRDDGHQCRFAAVPGVRKSEGRLASWNGNCAQ